MTHPISEVAQHYGISVHTLRFWDKKGLLSFVKRSPSGAREFNDDDASFLDIIVCLKSTGMKLEDIKRFVDWCNEGDNSIEQRLHLIEKHTGVVEKTIDEMMKNLVTLRYKVWYYQTALKAGTTAIHGPDSRKFFDQMMKNSCVENDLSERNAT